MAQYYVAESNGSDTPSRDGSLFQPWRTITYALAQAGTGDTILVRSGTYRERVVISAASMTVQAYAGETVTIDGGWTQELTDVGKWTPINYADYPVANADQGMIQISANNVTVDGLNVANSAARGIVVTGDNCTVKNLSIVRTLETSCLLYHVSGGLVQDVKIMAGSQSMKYYSDGMQSNWPHTVAPRSSTGTTWRRVEIYESEGEGFSSITGYGALIDGCKIVNCSKPMIYVNVSPGMIVRNCEIYCTDDYAGPRYTGKGLSVINGIKFADEDKAVSTATQGLTRDVEIYNNVIANVQKGLSFAQGRDSSGTLKHGAHAINCLIANNTFIEPAGNVLYLQDVLQAGREISGNVIENNIFHGAVVDLTSAGNRIRTGITFRHNYWSQLPSSWMRHGNDTAGSIGFVSGSIPSTISEFDPDNHDDFAATDYHVTASSPAVNAAIPNAVTTDYLGNARGAAPDQGFHEYNGSEPDPDVTLTAGFTMSANRVEESTAVTLTDTSTISAGTIDAWTWEYKLSSAASWTSHSTSATPGNLTIATAGTYQVRLTVTDTETSQSSAYVLTLTVTAAGEDDVDACTGNLLSNADFAGGTTGWSFNAGTGGSGSWAAGSGYADVTVTTASSTMQLYQTGMAITAGTQYRIAFRAKGGQSRTLRAFLFDNTTIQNLGVQAYDFGITTNWLAYELIFTATNTSANARLQLRVGLSTGSVQIDDICLAPYTAPSAPESVIVVPTDPAPINVEQTLSGTGSTGSPTAYSWSIDGVEVGTSSTYAWTPTSPRPYTIALTTTNAYGSDTSTITVNVYVPAAAGGTVAQLLRDTVPGSTGSDGGTDHTDIGTTGGVLMLTSGASTLGTAANDARIGIGATDGTNHRAIATHADHGVGTTNTRNKSDQATAYLISPTATVAVDGDVALTDADTTTVTWNTVESGDLYALLRIAATNAAAGDFVPGGAAVSVGFQPDIVFCFTAEGTTDFAASNDIGLYVSFGWATADGQRSIAMRGTNGAAAAASSAAYSQTYAAMVLTGSAVADGVTLTLNATGFSHTSTGTMTGKVGYLALKLDGLSTQIIDLDTETGAGTKNYTVSHVAGAAVALGTLANVVETVETFDDASAFSVGFWDGTNSRAVAITDDDAATTTVSKSHAANALLLVPAANGTDNILATVDDATSSTFVLNYTGVDATARKASILIIEQAAGSLTDIDYLQPGIATGTIPGMP